MIEVLVFEKNGIFDWGFCMSEVWSMYLQPIREDSRVVFSGCFFYRKYYVSWKLWYLLFQYLNLKRLVLSQAAVL